jgi:acyl-CoA synthetase (AMP-forming)/AMP-acid ligase II
MGAGVDDTAIASSHPEIITFADKLPLTAKGSVDRAKVAESLAH